MKRMRLDKFLSEMGVDTRKNLKEMIRCGRITVNGQPAANRNCGWTLKQTW